MKERHLGDTRSLTTSLFGRTSKLLWLQTPGDTRFLLFLYEVSIILLYRSSILLIRLILQLQMALELARSTAVPSILPEADSLTTFKEFDLSSREASFTTMRTTIERVALVPSSYALRMLVKLTYSEAT